MRRDTIFRIASMTKPPVAAVTMMLVEEGRIGLDDPVDRWLPELADRRVLKRLDGPLDETVPAKRAITTRDLLTMRMGLGIIMTPSAQFPIQKALNDNEILTGAPKPTTPHEPDEWLRRVAELPLMHQPGERWIYHIGFDVLGVLLTRASGKPLEDLLRERLFEPLGMKDTAFSLSAAQLERLTTSYRYRPQAGTLTLDDGVEDSLWSRPPAIPSASGGLVSTVDDYAAFGRMMLNQGEHNGAQILSKRSVEAMTSDHIPPEQKAISDFFPGFWDTRGWGYGMSVVIEPDELSATPGRYGWAGGYGTAWACDPHEDLLAVFMIQCMNFDGAPWIGEEFWRLLYQTP
jgi:CubicO group peptidase (beta-lactamase class C family)